MDRLVGLSAACRRAEPILPEMSPANLQTNDRRQLALSIAVELLDEIAVGIIKTYPMLSQAHPELRLTLAAAMRHVPVHRDDPISFDRLWWTAVRDIPDCSARIEALLPDADTADYDLA
ncbi:hypothetical protein LQ948_12210 [Jiella sp. MQZ9-1]|uniref:Uncharacterized protein n=1 Tax=Jiella flava TaxID=2816857 RepID=A0A939G047_9HYPH|nr:HepT-like ribonuclease domain-containing protein [Jiella flava]MBO0663400.1 hypothetical protein [Jiella flava]MCD2471975.1 hypothetical protein [Jiella flava]